MKITIKNGKWNYEKQKGGKVKTRGVGEEAIRPPTVTN